MLVEFFDGFQDDESEAALAWDIAYYTLGEGARKSTETRPLAGFMRQRWCSGSLT
jgi:hypothetical protein